MNGRRESSQNGRSMLELMGYMGAVIVIVAGISKIVNNVFGEFRMSEASIQLTDLSTAIVQASAIDIDYSDIVKTISNLENAEGRKIIPNSFRLTKNKIYHALGGEVTVSVPKNEYDASKTGDKFAITFSNLSREQCIELAMKDWKTNKIADLYAIIINSKDKWYWPIYTEIQEGENNHSLPILRSAVAGTDSEGECKTGRTNSIMWIFN